ncbi:MAG: trehalose-6-phosphate synthase [Anaerolineae bacterium]|nr:trehalose-6-phosphate synthase [Anaerolineae bacterium]
MAEHDPLIVIVSNRGPFSFRLDGSYKRGAGGLVTALAALGEQYDVLWVAAALTKADHQWAEKHANAPQVIDNTRLRLVSLDRRSYRHYYNVISNPLLWFIQHQLWDIPREPNINAETWEAWREGYVEVNRQIAQVVIESLRDVPPEQPILVFPQDYHLYLLPGFLREGLGDRVYLQPFIHIPWPGPDAWRILPAEMRNAILTGLLKSDRIGFQTKQDAFNFVQTCRVYLPDAHSHGARDTITYQDRAVEAAAYPISIDTDRVEAIAAEAQTRLYKTQLINLSADMKRIVRVDRIEPSKNIIRGLKAFAELLERHPEHRGKVQMLALLVPSRMEVSEYEQYWRDVATEAGMINIRYGDPMWEPVRIILGDNYHRAIAALQIYDVLLVNPIVDGMNLVAKEGSLVNTRDGVLILSENAGAVYELGADALVVSPYDVYSTAEAIDQALTMHTDEKQRRSAALRAQVKGANVHRWFQHQLDDALKNEANHASIPVTSETRTSL